MSRKYPTLESFIAASRAKHGDLYEYPDQPWPPENQRVKIVCKTHGGFSQRYFGHLTGAGCPSCWEARRGEKTRTKGCDVVKNVQKIFPHYGVDATSYKSAKDKIPVSCPIHGVFLSPYGDLMRGHGCPSCGKVKGASKRKEKALVKAKNTLVRLHPTLSFPNIEEEMTSTTCWITVVCPKHGKSKKQPHKMITSKQGCKFCGEEVRVEKKKIAVTEIYKRFAEAHGDTYDYSKCQVVKVMEPATIICKKHGPFKQTPQAHWSGQGCPSCGVERRAAASVVPFKVFLESAMKVHGSKYEYVEESYGGTSKAITIICKEHGPFSQTAVAHLYGCDCPSCSNKGFSPSKRAHVYVYKISKAGKQYAGFGITNNLRNRDADHQKTFSFYGAEGELIAKFPYRKGAFAASLESRLIAEVPITSTGMEGFIREASEWKEIGVILEIAKEHHQSFRNSV